MSDESPPPQGPQFNPQTGYPVGQQPPAYSQYQPQHQPQYQAPYQQPYGQGQPPYAPTDLPKATTAMVVGIVGLAGSVFCLLPILASPVAWVLGAQARRQIRSAPQQWGGEAKATAGMVLGIIGTVLLVLGLVALVVVIALLVNDPNFSDSDTRV